MPESNILEEQPWRPRPLHMLWLGLLIAIAFVACSDLVIDWELRREIAACAELSRQVSWQESGHQEILTRALDALAGQAAARRAIRGDVWLAFQRTMDSACEDDLVKASESSNLLLVAEEFLMKSVE